jgi:hypothetical protein
MAYIWIELGVEIKESRVKRERGRKKIKLGHQS